MTAINSAVTIIVATAGEQNIDGTGLTPKGRRESLSLAGRLRDQLHEKGHRFDRIIYDGTGVTKEAALEAAKACDFSPDRFEVNSGFNYRPTFDRAFPGISDTHKFERMERLRTRQTVQEIIELPYGNYGRFTLSKTLVELASAMAGCDEHFALAFSYDIWAPLATSEPYNEEFPLQQNPSAIAYVFAQGRLFATIPPADLFKPGRR